MMAFTSTTRPGKNCSTANRNISHGCVRLEDAPRLARWLLGRDPSEFGGQPEDNVLLPQAVPITLLI